MLIIFDESVASLSRNDNSLSEDKALSDVSIIVREANILGEMNEIIGLHKKFLKPDADQSRFTWLYLENPSGLAKAWLALDSNSDDVVGTAAIFPRKMFVNGAKSVGWVLGDFCVSPSCRSLGPAMALQRACLNFLQEDPSLRYYDFPSQSMLAVYRRLQAGYSINMSRAIKVLKVDKIIQRKIPVRWFARPIAWFGNVLLKWTLPKNEQSHGVEVKILEGPWGEEFTQLSNSLNTEYGVYVDRSSDYLNWRFYNSPLRQCQLIAVLKQGQLQGYGVIEQSTEDVIILDLFGVNTKEMLGQLLKFICFYGQSKGKISLQSAFFPTHWMTSIFEEMGFRMREQFPVILSHVDEYSNSRESQMNDWFLMTGDRDS